MDCNKRKLEEEEVGKQKTKNIDEDIPKRKYLKNKPNEKHQKYVNYELRL